MFQCFSELWSGNQNNIKFDSKKVSEYDQEIPQ